MWFMIDEFMLDWKNRYKTIRRIVKRNKFIFSLHRRLTDKEYQREKCKMSTCTTKTQKQIHEEMKKYACYWQCPADDYVRYGLFDKQLSMEKYWIMCQCIIFIVIIMINNLVM